MVGKQHSERSWLVSQVRLAENDSTSTRRFELCSKSDEGRRVRDGGQDEEAAGGSAETVTRFVCRMAGLNNLGGDREVRADGDVQPRRTFEFRLPASSYAWPTYILSRSGCKYKSEQAVHANRIVYSQQALHARQTGSSRVYANLRVDVHHRHSLAFKRVVTVVEELDLPVPHEQVAAALRVVLVHEQ